MANVFIITKEIETGKKLQAELAKKGLESYLATVKEKVLERALRESPQVIVLEMNGSANQTVLRDLTHGGKIRNKVPILALINAQSLAQPADYLGVDDFVFWPYDAEELAFRVKRLLERNLK